MTIFLSAIIYIFLIFSLSIKEKEVEISDFELRRKIELGDKKAAKLILKKQLVPIYNKFINYLNVFFVIVLAISLADFLRFRDAFLACCGLVFLAFILSRVDFVKKSANQIFKKISPKLYKIFSVLGLKLQKKILRLGKKNNTWAFYSKEEMLDCLSKHHNILNAKEQKWVEKVVILGEKTISDIMTPRDDLDILHAKDLLTPLVIDELFKSRQKFFAVMTDKETELLGVIHLDKITNIGKGDSQIVRNMMNDDFLVLRSDKNALEAFDKMMSEKYQFAFVQDKNHEFVGLVNLSDFIRKK